MLLTARDFDLWFPSTLLPDCHPEQAFFAQRRTCAEVRAEGTLAIRARHRPASSRTPALQVDPRLQPGAAKPRAEGSRVDKTLTCSDPHEKTGGTVHLPRRVAHSSPLLA